MAFLLFSLIDFRIRKNVITRKESYELIERHQISASGKSRQLPIGRQPQTNANQQKSQQKPPQQQQQNTQQIVGPQQRSKQKGSPKYLKESQVNDIQHQLHHGAHNYYGNPQQGYQSQSKQDSGSFGSGSYNEIVEIEHHPPPQKPQKIQEPPPKQTGKQSARNQPQSDSRNLEEYRSPSDSLTSNNVIRKTITKTYYYGPSSQHQKSNQQSKNQQQGNRGYGSASPPESIKSNTGIITTKTYYYSSAGNRKRSNQQSKNQQQSKRSKSKINTIYDSPTESIASNNGEIVTTKTYHYSSSGNQQRNNQQSRHQQQRKEFQSSSRGNPGYVSPSESMRSNHGKNVTNQQRSNQQVRSQTGSFTAQTPLTGIRSDGPRQQRAGSFPHGRHGNQQLQSSNHSHSSTQTGQQEALEGKKSKN